MISRLKPQFGLNEINALFIREKNPKRKIEFEKFFSETINAKYSLAFPYARMGFYTILQSISVKEKSILMPAFTCVVMADLASIAGYVIKFVDIQKNLIVSVNDIIRPENENIGVILLTDLFGNQLPGADKEKIKKWAKSNNIILIEDKAMNLNINDKSVYGDFQIYSFMLNKQISTIFGGIASTDSQAYFEKLKESHVHFFKKRNFYQNLRLRLLYLSQLDGYNRLTYKYLMPLQNFIKVFRNLVNYYNENKPTIPENAFLAFTNFQASIGIKQLKKADYFDQMRKALYEVYQSELKSVNAIALIHFDNLGSYPYFSILVNNRKDFIQHMFKKGVDVEHIFEYAIPNLNYYKSTTNAKFPISSEVAEKIVNLPLYPSLNEKDVKDICKKIKEYYN